MTLNDDFRPNANPQETPRDRFIRFEQDLRDRFYGKLVAAVAAHDGNAATGTVDIDYARHLRTLHELASAFTPGSHAHLYFEREKALPVSIEHAGRSFNESLVRLRTDTGGNINPKELFGALEDESFGEDLATSFREWLIFASILDYNDVNRVSGLSVNIAPHDMDSAEFRETLDHGFALFKECGFAPLILEATEYAPWKRDRRIPLQDMIKKHGLTLAIDDYGAHDGYNYTKALRLFARDMPPRSLIVKIDGQVVMDFLQHKNNELVDRLTEIANICNQPIVVAEWLPSIADVLTLRERLKPHGLHNMIGLVQSIYLQNETPSTILRKLDMLEREGGAAPAP